MTDQLFMQASEADGKVFGVAYRGRYHMPLLPGENGPKAGGDYVPRGVMRVTNLVGAFEDTRALSVWEQGMGLIGLALAPELYEELVLVVQAARTAGTDFERLRDYPELKEALAGAPHDQRKQELSLIGRAKAIAKAGAAAQRGTNRHTAWEHRGKTGELIGTPAICEQVVDTERLLADAGLVRVPGLSERVVRNTVVGAVGKFDDVLFEVSSGRLLISDLKGLALDTPLPTPSGWTTMGAVGVGDLVYDKDGVPTAVIGKSEIKQIGTYIVRFDDGSEIVCDREHIWWTGVVNQSLPRARTVDEVIDTLRHPRTGQCQHVVPIAGALQAPYVTLPVDPYILGVWLGDGQRMGGVITGQIDMFDCLRDLGYVLGKCTVDKRRSTTLYHSVLGLVPALRKAGILGYKVIPDAYLRASASQRLALLQGLMDTDGTWNTARKTAVFYSVDKALATQVTELLSTLGQRPYMATVPTRGFGKDVISYHVSFTPVGLVPFKLERKAVQAQASLKSTVKSSRRLIVSIEPGPDVPTACIAVDSPSSTYLAGEKMIPTHNTKATPFFSWTAVDAQLATYAWADWMLTADGQGYEPGPVHHVDLTEGVILHVPSDGSPARLERADLVGGWEDAQLAARVIARRAYGRSVDRHSQAVWTGGQKEPSQPVDIRTEDR